MASRERSKVGEARYSLQELTEAANVSVRTVRYYIAEGLLPPPVSAGARSFYSDAHLNRLRLIGLLKERFLPLKEIRRQLRDLDDAAIRDTLIEADADTDPTIAASVDEHHFSLDREALRQPRLVAEESAADYIAHVLGEHAAPVVKHRKVVTPASSSTPMGDALYRRIALGDDAELVISDALYQRRKERVDALIAWAQRVLTQD